MMNLFKKRKTTISIVDDDELYFTMPDRNGGVEIIDRLPLEEFLTDTTGPYHLPQQLCHRTNALLIVPDYWVGTTTYRFQSRKRSLIEPFIERKLQTEHPDLPHIRYFSEYIPYQTEERQRMLYVYFLQEPRCFQLYDQLGKLNLSPGRITSSAFLWEQKLRRVISDFCIDGKVLVHLLPKESYLYFFFRGYFLFSRSITFAQLEMESSERFDTLTFEMNQSLILFSQKAKADAGKIYLFTSGESVAEQLSEALGKEVQDLNAMDESLSTGPGLGSQLPVFEGFSISDLFPSNKFLSLSHSQLRKELEWKPIQTAGIAIGLILLLLLSLECLFLWQWSQSGNVPVAQVGILTEADTTYTIQQYTEALDFIKREMERPSPKDMILKVGRSLPDNFWTKELVVQLEGESEVKMKGVIRASGPDKFRESVSILLNNLKKDFQGARSLRIQDIDFEISDSDIHQTYQDYLITLRFVLP